MVYSILNNHSYASKLMHNKQNDWYMNEQNKAMAFIQIILPSQNFYNRNMYNTQCARSQSLTLFSFVVKYFQFAFIALVRILTLVASLNTSATPN